ncbi:uncharacterized protein LOC123555810 [Mercenaria mercenaria]|uniref:uncharacterized protein LOC123555810 n=1 Tax=Mercenaria mercenaria TaxID=6596 RepID=UPI00234E6BE4|nr:uncharacterized protein LOC123555810 [Mercenaria mercenaria]
MERTDIVLARINFLKKIKKFREDGRTIVYTDETFVHSSHTFHRSWQSDHVGLRVPFRKGQRMIIVHAGTETGFVKGAELVFKSQSHTGDYHDEMNSTNFMKWLQEKLLPNLPQRSVLIVDNAPYHNIQTDKCPTTATRKSDIQGWLRRHNIDFDEKLLKAELLDLCKRNKPSPEYLLDRILKEHGHDCLRLPAYHADLNAIELVWAQLKGIIGRHKVSFRTSDLEQHIYDAISTITDEDWQSCCTHVQKVEQEYWKSDIAVAEDMDDIVVEVCSSDEDTDTASEGYASDTDTADEDEDNILFN